MGKLQLDKRHEMIPQLYHLDQQWEISMEKWKVIQAKKPERRKRDDRKNSVNNLITTDLGDIVHI